MHKNESKIFALFTKRVNIIYINAISTEMDGKNNNKLTKGAQNGVKMPALTRYLDLAILLDFF